MKTHGIFPLIRNLVVTLVLTTAGPVFAGHLDASQHDIEHLHQLAAPQGTKAKSVKAGCVLLAKALRSDGLAAVLTYIRSNGTKEAAATIGKHATTIAKTLEELVKWEELSTAMVRGQVAGGLRSAGVAESTAKTAAFWIEQVITGLFM